MRSISEICRGIFIWSAPLTGDCANIMQRIPLLYWTVIPQTDLQKPDNPDKVKKNYQKVLTLLNNMNMQHEFRNC